MNGIITSSPGSVPKYLRRRCIPAVAEARATAPAAPQKPENLFSNSTQLLPIVNHPLSRTCLTASIPSRLMVGKKVKKLSAWTIA